MRRISTSTKVTDKFGAGKHGFRNGDRVNSILPTQLEADLFDHLQEEIARFCEAYGLTVDGSTYTQLQQAAKRGFGGNISILTATGALTLDQAGLVVVNATAGNIVLTLPTSASLAGVQYQFVRADSSANTVTIQTSGGDTVDGAASFLVNGQYGTQAIRANGIAGWHTISLISTTPTSSVPVGMVAHVMASSPPTGWLAANGAAVSRTSYSALRTALTVSSTASITNASTAVTGLASTTQLQIGTAVEGAGIAAGTTVAAITGATSITLSAAATATNAAAALTFYPFGAGDGATTFALPDLRGRFLRGWDGSTGNDQTALTGTTTNASASVTGLPSTVGLFVGMSVTGTGIAGGSTVAQINSATTITLSANATASGTVPLTFSGRALGTVQADDFKSHQHGAGAAAANSAAAGSPNVSYGVVQLTSATGGAETRPKNVAALAIIKF